jgi:CBS domain-containing protein
MTIGAILKQKPLNIVVVRPDDRVADVVRGLARQKIGVAVVMDGDALVGIISERDVMRGLDAQGSAVLETTVDRHMIRNVRTCTTHTTVDQAIDAMTRGRFRHLPVLDEGKLLGVISIRDLLNSMVAKQAVDVSSLCGYVTGAYASVRSE